jgi:hypothetical protein
VAIGKKPREALLLELTLKGREADEMTPGTVLAILKKIASSTYRGRLGLALIDEVCHPFNLSDTDVSRVINRLVEQGYVTNVSVGIVAITAEGINRAFQFFC